MIIPESCSLNEGELQPPFLRRKSVVYQDRELDTTDVADVGAFLDNIFPGRAVLVSHPTFFEEKDNIYTGRLTSLLSSNGASDPITGLLHEIELRLQQLQLASELGLIVPEEAERQSREWYEKPNPTIKQMIIDIDGTVLGLKYKDHFNTSFSNSFFGETVFEEFKKLIGEYNRDMSGALNEKAILDSPMSFIRNNDVCNYLEEKYWHQVYDQMLVKYKSLYGERRGQPELDTYLDNYPHLRNGYHVFRWLTHGKVDIDEVFEKPNDELPGWISQSVASGVRSVFLTASPRIHALKMLERAGLMEALKNGEITLMTAEDLYHPGSLSEMSKAVAIAACTWGEDENAFERFREIEKNEIKAIKMYQTYLQLRERRNDVPVIPAKQTVSIGDQWEFDVDPAKQCGAYAYLVDGPGMVQSVGGYF